ncbi:hypothetical protein EBU99_06355 [bacterium]|nr:hypothetical protein [bacterium]
MSKSVKDPFRLLCLYSFVFAFSVLALPCWRASADELVDEDKKGSAADLDGIPALGWPLGAPLSCRELDDALKNSLARAVATLQGFCNQQNAKMSEAGFQSCGVNECLDSLVVSSGGYDHGKFAVVIGQDPWTGDTFIKLNYTYPALTPAPNRSLVCFDPAVRGADLVRGEFAAWDFKRFTEFCVAPRLP